MAWTISKRIHNHFVAITQNEAGDDEVMAMIDFDVEGKRWKVSLPGHPRYDYGNQDLENCMGYVRGVERALTVETDQRPGLRHRVASWRKNGERRPTP